MSLFDGIKRRLGLGGSVDEVVQEAQSEDGGFEVPNTRVYRRAIRRSMRLKGPGYTRPMRKGRTQRG